RLEARRADCAERPRAAMERRAQGRRRRQLLQLPPASAAGTLFRHDRTEPAQFRQAARQLTRGPEIRLWPDLQFQGLQAVLADAAPWPLRNAERAADQGPGRIPG